MFLIVSDVFVSHYHLVHKYIFGVECIQVIPRAFPMHFSLGHNHRDLDLEVADIFGDNAICINTKLVTVEKWI